MRAYVYEDASGLEEDRLTQEVAAPKEGGWTEDAIDRELDRLIRRREEMRIARQDLETISKMAAEGYSPRVISRYTLVDSGTVGECLAILNGGDIAELEAAAENYRGSYR